MRASYMFSGQLAYANRQGNESPTAAVARSLKRRLGTDVSLSFQERNAPDIGSETWIAKWYDPQAETFREEIVKL